MRGSFTKGVFSVAAGTLLLCGMSLQAQTKFVPNYDESKVPQYTLPDPLVTAKGDRVKSKREWVNQRRPEILRLFESEVYGRMPREKVKARYEVTSEDRNALNGKATRKEVALHLSRNGITQMIQLLLYLPNQVKGRVPAFLGMNFYGNQSIHPDPGITLSTNWMRNTAEMGIKDHRATEASRGKHASRWDVDAILNRGYAVATVYYGDVVPDDPTIGIPRGVHRLFDEGIQSKSAGDEWGAIAGWAWGLSRTLDYLEKDPRIDTRRVAVMGHSRLGKAALWAGATDERFAIVISNNSGCGGAALSRRKYGETVWRINTAFPHWFCGNFNRYNNKEEELPIDQHMLIALMAPRPVYVASAEDDKWADPRGEFLSAKHAEPVYALFGRAGLGVDDLPSLNQSVGNSIGYHIRTGKHDVTAFDWAQYLAFADRHFRGHR